MYCYRDSFIELEAKKLKLNIIHCPKGKIDSAFDLQIFLDLKGLINKLNLHFINCQHIKVLWILCFILRKNSQVSLFFTTGKAFRKSFKNFLFNILAKRIDNVFVPTIEYKKNVLRSLNIISSKVIPLGLGISTTNVSREEKDGEKRISLYVAPHEKVIEDFNTIFIAISHVAKIRKNISLTFVTEKRWENHLLYKELQEASMLYGIESIVSYKERLEEKFKDHSDIWVDLGNNKTVNPFLLEIFLTEASILVARKPIIFEILRNSPGQVETFKEGDPRELRDKLLKLFSSKARGTKKYRDYLEEISKTNDRKSYLESLSSHYKRGLGLQYRSEK